MPKKGDPTVCVPSLRYGQPAVLSPAGVPLELAALRQSRSLIRLDLRSSAHTEGGGGQDSDSETIEPALRAQCCYVFSSCLRTYYVGWRLKTLNISRSTPAIVF